MLILSQDKSKIVNIDNAVSIVVINHEPYATDDKQFGIIAWCGSSGYDCNGLGNYKTEERCKEILKEIFAAYATYKIAGPSSHPDLCFNQPKTYEMPEE